MFVRTSVYVLKDKCEMDKFNLSRSLGLCIQNVLIYFYKIMFIHEG